MSELEHLLLGGDPLPGGVAVVLAGPAHRDPTRMGRRSWLTWRVQQLEGDLDRACPAGHTTAADALARQLRQAKDQLAAMPVPEGSTGQTSAELVHEACSDLASCGSTGTPGWSAGAGAPARLGLGRCLRRNDADMARVISRCGPRWLATAASEDNRRRRDVSLVSPAPLRTYAPSHDLRRTPGG